MIVKQELSDRILIALRQSGVLDIAARVHAQRLAEYEKDFSIDPRTRVPAPLREARKIQEQVSQHGPEILASLLMPAMEYAAARWAQMSDPQIAEAFPYFRYTCFCSASERPGHKEKDGLILPRDHPFWMVWYPPNGMGCGCSASSVSESALQTRSWRVSENLAFAYPFPDEGFDFNIGIAAGASDFRDPYEER